MSQYQRKIPRPRNGNAMTVGGEAKGGMAEGLPVNPLYFHTRPYRPLIGKGRSRGEEIAIPGKKLSVYVETRTAVKRRLSSPFPFLFLLPTNGQHKLPVISAFVKLDHFINLFITSSTRLHSSSLVLPLLSPPPTHLPSC